MSCLMSGKVLFLYFITLSFFDCIARATKPNCDSECFENKLEEILAKLNHLEQRVDELQPHRHGLHERHGAHGRHRFHECSPKLKAICQSAGLSTFQVEEMHTSFPILCDNERWIIIMQRLDGSVYFHNKTWADYKAGFGRVESESEFFLGLEHLHEITSTGSYQLRITLEQFNGVHRLAFYSDFNVGDEQGAYKLESLGVYSGGAGDSFSYHEGQRFSTVDRDNDEKQFGSCAAQFNSAGWFKDCMEANLMGQYFRGEMTQYKEGIYWSKFRDGNYPLKSLRLFIRAKCNN